MQDIEMSRDTLLSRRELADTGICSYDKLVAADCDISAASIWNFNWLLGSPAYAQGGICVVDGVPIDLSALGDCADVVEGLLNSRDVPQWLIKAVRAGGTVLNLVTPTALGGPFEYSVQLATGEIITISGSGDTIGAALTIGGISYRCYEGACFDQNGNPSDYVLVETDGGFAVETVDETDDEDTSGSEEPTTTTGDPGCEPDEEECWEDYGDIEFGSNDNQQYQFRRVCGSRSYNPTISKSDFN